MTDSGQQRKGGPNAAQQSPSEALRDLLESHRGDLRCVELCPICRGAEVLRATASPEMREGWHSVQRETLLTMRALIDSYLERLEADGGEQGPRVEEIPIE